MRFAIPALTLAAALALAAGPAAAKLPPPSDEAKAKAAETAAKNAWTDKVGAFQLCQSMNRTADHYRKSPAGNDAPQQAADQDGGKSDAERNVPVFHVAQVP
mgnify:CR=1 FL=1